MNTRDAGSVVLIGLVLAACHQPEQPPVPPTPNNPTVEQTIALQRVDVIDASIVSEGGQALDAVLPPLRSASAP
jgi:hypothetical protein